MRYWERNSSDRVDIGSDDILVGREGRVEVELCILEYLVRELFNELWIVGLRRVPFLRDLSQSVVNISVHLNK